MAQTLEVHVSEGPAVVNKGEEFEIQPLAEMTWSNGDPVAKPYHAYVSLFTMLGDEMPYLHGTRVVHGTLERSTDGTTMTFEWEDLAISQEGVYKIEVSLYETTDRSGQPTKRHRDFQGSARWEKDVHVIGFRRV